MSQTRHDANANRPALEGAYSRGDINTQSSKVSNNLFWSQVRVKYSQIDEFQVGVYITYT